MRSVIEQFPMFVLTSALPARETDDYFVRGGERNVKDKVQPNRLTRYASAKLQVKLMTRIKKNGGQDVENNKR